MKKDINLIHNNINFSGQRKIFSSNPILTERIKKIAKYYGCTINTLYTCIIFEALKIYYEKKFN